MAIATRVADRPRRPCRLLQQTLTVEQVKLLRRRPLDLVRRKDWLGVVAAKPELLDQIGHDAMRHSRKISAQHQILVAVAQCATCGMGDREAHDLRPLPPRFEPRLERHLGHGQPLPWQVHLVESFIDEIMNIPAGVAAADVEVNLVGAGGLLHPHGPHLEPQQVVLWSRGELKSRL